MKPLAQTSVSKLRIQQINQLAAKYWNLDICSVSNLTLIEEHNKLRYPTAN